MVPNTRGDEIAIPEVCDLFFVRRNSERTRRIFCDLLTAVTRDRDLFERDFRFVFVIAEKVDLGTVGREYERIVSARRRWQYLFSGTRGDVHKVHACRAVR